MHSGDREAERIMKVVELLRQQTEGSTLEVTAEIAPSGELLCVSTESGPATEEVWGADRCEFRLEVEPSEKERLLRILLHSFWDEEKLSAWLEENGFRYQVQTAGERETEETDGPAVRLPLSEESAPRELTVRGVSEDFLLLLQLRYLFEQQYLGSLSEFHRFLESRKIPHTFQRVA
ncbi:MAG: hypothetical protein Kow00109_13650 [Acidobacteriota bacterium]